MRLATKRTQPLVSSRDSGGAVGAAARATEGYCTHLTLSAFASVWFAAARPSEGYCTQAWVSLRPAASPLQLRVNAAPR